MVLDEDKILELIDKPANPHIKGWQKNHDTLSIYVEGGDVASELEKIKNYENEEQKKLRKKVARSTKDKVHNLLKPINKIFSASGGSYEIDGLNDSQSKEFNALIQKLPENISVRQWMENYWKDAFVKDPNGIILIETNDEGITYPTYKSINNIVDYKSEWDSFEYVILKHKKAFVGKDEVQVFRVYDDKKDALYYIKDKKLQKYGNTDDDDSYDEDHIYYNQSRFVPAIICGGIIDQKTGGKKSFLNKIDESLKEYLRASSVHTIYKFLHLFPKFWSYAMKCTTCNGTGEVIDKKSNETPKAKKICPSCKGKKLKIVHDVSDGIHLPLPKNDQPVLGGNIAGYIDTPSGVWEQQNQDLSDMMRQMEFTLWGAYLNEEPSKDSKKKTATEAFINVQPINDELHSISRCAETKESTILTYMAKMMYSKADVKARYGKRFLVEGPDALWKKYIEAKKENAPVTTLDYHYEQYLMSEYQNDPAMMQMRKKMLSIEPFAHYTVNDISGIVSKDILSKKIMFSSWLMTNVNWDNQAEQLKKEFEEYFNTNKPELIQKPNTNENA